MGGINAATIFLLAAIVAVAAFARDLIGMFRKWRKHMTAEERAALRAPMQFNRDAVALQSAVLRDLRDGMAYKDQELARRDTVIQRLEQENAQLKAERTELYATLGQIRAQRYKQQGEQQ